MNRPNYLQEFMNLCIQCLSVEGVNELVGKSSYVEQIAFHKVHERFLSIAHDHRMTAQLIAMEDRYPFLKIEGRWHISNVKLYLYLQAARPVMLKTKNADMLNLYDAVQSSSEYLQRAKELDKTLTPSGCIDYEDYQVKLGELYRQHKTEQASLLEKLKFTVSDPSPRSVIRGELGTPPPPRGAAK